MIAALIGVLLQASNGLLIYVSFAINRDYIARDLCMRRDDPTNRCKGSCHLKKQLSEAQETASVHATTLPKAVSMELYWESPNVHELPKFVHLQDEGLDFPSLALLRDDQVLEYRIFHPPKRG